MLSVANILVGGGCVAIGGIIVAIIQGVFGHGEKKAAAAAQLSQSAASLTERWEAANRALEEKLDGMEHELRGVKDAIDGLVDKVDEVIPLLEQAGHAEIAINLRDANRTVRRVI